MTDFDKAAQHAMDARVKQDMTSKVSEWWDDQPRVLTTVISILGGGVIAAAVSWEGNASGQGWMRIAEGTAPAVFCWIWGFCCTLGYIVAHRVSSEAIRDKQPLRTPIVAAVLFAGLSLVGVVANQVERAEIRTVVSGDTGTARGDAIARVRTLRSRVDTFDAVTMQAMLEADKRSLTAMQAEATGWGMADLDAACNADLRPRQRQLCNMTNGPDGLLASIAITSAAIESHETSKIALEIAEEELGGLKAERTSNFWRGMAQIVPGEEADLDTRTAKVSAFGSLIISIVILFGTAFIIDVVLEYRQRRRERKA